MTHAMTCSPRRGIIRAKGIPMNEVAMISIPIWIAIPILLVVLFGAWKIVKLLWLTLSQ